MTEGRDRLLHAALELSVQITLMNGKVGAAKPGCCYVDVQLPQ